MRLLNGGAASTIPARGQVALVAFWATWCPRSRQLLPHLAALQRRFGRQGLRVLAVSVGEDSGVVARHLSSHRLECAAAWTGRREARELGRQFDFTGLPTIYLVDAGARVRHASTGYLPGMEEALEREVRALLSDAHRRSR